MSKQLSLSFFSTQSPNGIALRDAFVQLVKRLDFKLKMSPHPTVVDVANACWNDDVVVFDGSIEDEGHNYEIAFEPLKGMRHALIVSRTPLPLNFFGLRKGGAPDHPDTLSNEEILDYPVMQCSSEQCNERREGDSASFSFDMDGLLWMREDNLFPIESQQLELVTEEGKPITCPRCGTAYRVRRERRDRYLYLALPVGDGTQGKNLQALPVYRAEQI